MPPDVCQEIRRSQEAGSGLLEIYLSTKIYCLKRFRSITQDIANSHVYPDLHILYICDDIIGILFDPRRRRFSEWIYFCKEDKTSHSIPRRFIGSNCHTATGRNPSRPSANANQIKSFRKATTTTRASGPIRCSNQPNILIRMGQNTRQ